MSLLLKALKQAEAAHAGKSDAERLEGNRVDDTLELEPLTSTGSDSASEWVEPPGLLFGNTGPGPGAAAPRPVPAFRLPQLSLVPVVALLAGVIAVGYGVYLYFALQPPEAALPPPPAPAAQLAPPEIAPIVASAVPAPAAPVRPNPPSVATVESPAVALPPVAPAASPVRPVPNPEAASIVPSNTSSPPVTPRRAMPSATQPARPASDTPQPTPPLQFQPDAQSTLLSQGHAAYQRGAMAEAQRLYTQAAARNRGVDALLGLAAIASVQGREIDAQRLYREVLDLNPRNASAQAALLDLLGNTDGPATESRLKTLIDRDPSPQLYQTLGNLYADQKRWSDAQAAYFEAYRYAPDNADYAFNLAVSLDQLRQGTAALKYYEKALATGGVHRFDRAQAELRVQQLKTTR